VYRFLLTFFPTDFVQIELGSGVGVFSHGEDRENQKIAQTPTPTPYPAASAYWRTVREGLSSMLIIMIIFLLFYYVLGVLLLLYYVRLPSMFFADRGTSQSIFLCIFIFIFLCSLQAARTFIVCNVIDTLYCWIVLSSPLLSSPERTYLSIAPSISLI
jgi:hypothetical protein